MNSPIKYFGGKGGKMGLEIYKLFPDKSQFEVYIEPFGGGASVLFIKDPYGSEIYNDLEENVYSLFKVLADTKLFHEFKRLCDLSFYSRKLRDEYIEDLKKSDVEIIDRAYKYFYVNRTSVNGIGGFSITSNYIRRGMSKSTSDFLSSIDGLKEVHERLSRVIIENKNGIDLIRDNDRPNVFIYADPPYHFSTRSTTRYKVDMDDKIQSELIGTLINMKHAKVLISGYCCSEYDRLTNAGWEKFTTKVKAFYGEKAERTEVLWRNYTVNKVDNKVDLPKYFCDKNTPEITPEIATPIPRKNRGRPKLFDCPKSLRCSKCGGNKKTNPYQFYKQLGKSNLDKEIFINQYVCRSCKKILK